MKQITVMLVLMLATSLSFSQTTTWTGYLVDKVCSTRLTDAAKAANHTKECLAEEFCATSGYGITVDGKWYKFDKKGDALATALLNSTTRDKGFKITVTGVMKKKKINVTNITEAD